MFSKSRVTETPAQPKTTPESEPARAEAPIMEQPAAPAAAPRKESAPRIGPAFSGRASSPAVQAPPDSTGDRRSANVIADLASGVIGEMPPPAVEEDASLRTLIDAVHEASTATSGS